MNLRLVLKILVSIVLGMIAIGIVLNIIGVVVWFAHTAFVLAILAAIGYAALYCVRLSQKQSSGAPSKGGREKRFSLTGAEQVYIFRQQPGVRDLIGMTNDIHAAKLELSGDVVPVPKGTPVIVLEDGGDESVKIRIKGAKKKDDLDGWVDRAYLRAETK